MSSDNHCGCTDKNCPTCRTFSRKFKGKDTTTALKQNISDVRFKDIPKITWKHKAKHYRSHGLSVLHLKPSGSCRLWANVHITYLLHPDIVNLAVALIWKLNVFVLDLNASFIWTRSFVFLCISFCPFFCTEIMWHMSVPSLVSNQVHFIFTYLYSEQYVVCHCQFLNKILHT